MTKPVEWQVWPGLVPIERAHEIGEERMRAVRDDGAPEAVFLVEHPMVVSHAAGDPPVDLPADAPTFEARRGGAPTWQGPGQRGVLVILDIKARGLSLADHQAMVEDWIIAAVAALGVDASRREDHGIWSGGKQLAALALRLRAGVAGQGFFLNVDPDLDALNSIPPCGIEGCEGTSLGAELGTAPSLRKVDAVLRRAFVDLYGPTILLP